MKAERTQKGNPHGLTIKQHTFPRASIARFANSQGLVSAQRRKGGKCFRVKPDHELFCAMRVWDQRVEDGFNREIETPFQTLADAIIAGSIFAVGKSEKKIVNASFALCCLRAEWKSQQIPSQPIPFAIGLQHNTTNDNQELLEKCCVTCFGPGVTIPGRSVAGSVMQLRIFDLQRQLEDSKWGIMKAATGQFLVPDNLSYGRVLPISPSICLVSAGDNGLLSEGEVAWLNQSAIRASTEYYFANDLHRCPF
jgi:hypothetical protein